MEIQSQKISEFYLVNNGFSIRFIKEETYSNGRLLYFNLVHDYTGLYSSMFLFSPINFHFAFAFPTKSSFRKFHCRYSKIHSDKFWNKLYCPLYSYPSVLKLAFYDIDTRIRLSRQSEIVF